MGKIITGKNIVKIFGTGEEQTKALDVKNIEIKKGEFIAVMGESGCGKSTLLFALSGTDQISSGSIRFKNADLSELGENELADIRRTQMGFVFQNPTMLRNLNILDNIILPTLQDKKTTPKNMVKKAKALMSKTGIPGLEGRDITEVSGGQLQRAGICRSLIGVPEIIFADEPTGALNSKASNDIMDLFSDINESGTALFFVTHDAKVASRAERVLFMKDGEIVSELNLKKFTKSNIDQRLSEVILQIKEIDIINN